MSSIRGFQHIHESDMLLMPDPTTAYVDPTLDIPTLILGCDVVEPETDKPYSRDPRYVARKAERYLAERHATTSFWGRGVEFYIFDSLRFETAGHKSMYGSIRTRPSGTQAPQRDGQPRASATAQGGLLPVPPMDTLQDLRSRMVLALQASGIDVEVQHHEVGGPGQAEMRHPLRDAGRDGRQGPSVQVHRQAGGACGRQGRHVPAKPLYGGNGSGMHTHQSLWNDRSNLFYDDKGYALLSDLAARWYIGGLLKHAKAVLAFAAPTTNSYPPGARLRGARSPRVLAAEPVGMHPDPDVLHDAGRTSARVPVTRPATRTCRLSAQLIAELDGVVNQVEPPARPSTADIYELAPRKRGSKAHGDRGARRWTHSRPIGVPVTGATCSRRTWSMPWPLQAGRQRSRCVGRTLEFYLYSEV